MLKKFRIITERRLRQQGWEGEGGVSTLGTAHWGV